MPQIHLKILYVPLFINNLKKDSEILVLQVLTISKKRLSKKIGNITKDQVEQIKQGIDLYLNY